MAGPSWRGSHGVPCAVVFLLVLYVPSTSSTGHEEAPAEPRSGAGVATDDGCAKSIDCANNTSDTEENLEDQETIKTLAGEAGHQEHGKVSAVAWTMAVMLVCFFVLNTLMLYLVNYRDANIRCYMYSMINSTVSIFCAVLTNEAAYSILMDQLLPAPFPRGLGLTEVGEEAHDDSVRNNTSVLVAFLFFCLHFKLLSMFCRRHEGDRILMSSVKSLGGHLLAFAGIQMFTSVNNIPWMRPLYLRVWMSVPAAWAMTVVFRAGFQYLRAQDTTEPSSWVTDVQEAEDEATVMICSFLVQQGICVSFIQRIPKGDTYVGVDTDVAKTLINGLGYVALAILCLLIISTFVRGKMTTGAGLVRRVLANSQNGLAMTLSWLLYSISDWMVQEALSFNVHLAHVVNAFAATLTSIVVILILDFIADRLQEQIESDSGDSEESTTDVVTQNSAISKNLERTVRTIINSFGLFVGVSWERAFHVADETIAHGVGHMRHHPVVAKVSIAATTVCFVLPAWRMFIVPKALLSEEDHLMRIIEEEEQEEEEEEDLEHLEAQRIASEATGNPH